jgi:phosphatidylinositol 4-kinase type 2
MTHAQFNEVVEEVKSAIQQGIQPKLNKAGSSGSYFVRNTSNKTVGIFKPKG